MPADHPTCGTGDVPWDDLDPGIRETVRFIRGLGFATTDSGDGRSKLDDPDHDPEQITPWPHVGMLVEPGRLIAECDRLRAALEGARIEVGATSPEVEGVEIQGSYDPCNGIAVIFVSGLDDERLRQALAAAEEDDDDAR